MSPTEKSRLLSILPQTEFSARGRFEFLRSRPEGGACQLLTAHRCTAHGARPGPCREFPLSGYVGTRIQAVAVLGCPGIDLGFLDGYRGPESAGPSQGLDSEIAALRSRVGGSAHRRLDESGRRRRKLVRALEDEERWVDEDEVRRRLRERPPVPTDADFPSWAPPSEEDGLELLPLMFDGRAGPVAFAASEAGWELLELRPEGGVERSLGVAPPPERLPAMTEDAWRVVEGYLRYWAERDQLFGTVHLDMAESSEGNVVDCAAAELRQIGATTISRAHVISRLHGGEGGLLSRSDVHQGIRATDADLLDRRAWGTRL